MTEPLNCYPSDLIFNGGWLFAKTSKIPDALPSDWESVELPRTWNAVDGQDGGNDYWRGTATEDLLENHRIRNDLCHAMDKNLGELEQNDSFFDEYHRKYPDSVIGFYISGEESTFSVTLPVNNI